MAQASESNDPRASFSPLFSILFVLVPEQNKLRFSAAELSQNKAGERALT
jgi:hypothetical protein